MAKRTINKENVQKLVTALRSGNFTQCDCKLVEDLRDVGRSHCCIGVAAEISGRSFESILKYANQKIDGSVYNSVAKWLGLQSYIKNEEDDVNGLNPNNITYYIKMNDDEKSFDEIADKLEQLIKEN